MIQEVQNIIDILIICKVTNLNLQNILEKDLKQIINQINKSIRSIQVDFKGQKTTIYFSYKPIYSYLSQSTQSFFTNGSSVLESRNQKMRYLINFRNIIYQDINHRKSRQLIMGQTHSNYLFTFSVLLCFLIIGLQLLFFSVNQIRIAMDPLQTSLISGLSYTQLIVSIIYFTLWGMNLSPITQEKIKQKYKLQFRQSHKISQTKYFLLLFRQIYIQENSSLHALIILIISILGCTVDIRLYSLVLLCVFAKIQILSNIMTAIRMTWGKLLLVCFLALAFTFIFGLLTMNYYIKVLYQHQQIDIDIDHIQSHCSTIITCLQSLLTQRIIGETPSRDGDSNHYGRFFSDVIYSAFFQILLTNIIAAIIIDKFAQLRNIKQKIQNQKHNRCLICYANKSNIQRKGQLFEQHVRQKHCVWNYFFYLYYLQKLKSNTQYSGIQYWIVKQIKEGKIQWFPQDENLKDQLNQQRILKIYLDMQKKLKDDKNNNQQMF